MLIDLRKMLAVTIKIGLIAVLCSIQVSAKNKADKFSIDFKWQDSISQKTKKNILDYFLLLPSTYLDCEMIQNGFPTLDDRKDLCQTIDLKNGYIKFFRNAEIVLFRNRKDSIDFIAIQIGKCGAGSTCGGINEILEYLPEQKKWQKRDDLLPDGYSHKQLYEKYIDKDICPYFVLPQYGFILTVKDENSGKNISTLKWNGSRFTVVQNDK